MPVSQTTRREDAKTKTLRLLLPAEVYIAVDVVDGTGEKSNHVIFRARGTKQFYRLLPPGAEKAMQPLQKWLNDLADAQAAKLSSDAPTQEEKEESPAVPPDMEELV